MISLCSLLQLIPNFEEKIEEWNDNFIYLWAMNGDFISQIYSGTESVLTKITLKGH